MAIPFSAAENAPARRLLAVTPSDSVDIAAAVRALYVGGGGNISVIASDDSAAVVLVAVPTGTVLHIRAKRVKSTGTTATSIVALI